MKKESLEEALDVIIDSIDKSDIDIVDKVELMINLKEFLNKISYEENIKTLMKGKNDKVIKVLKL